MATFLFYPASVFRKGLPSERYGLADGRGSLKLTLEKDASPVRIVLRDDDKTFDEIDGTQALAEPVTLDGVTYPAGTTVNAAYDLIDSGSGHKITALHLGGDGWQQGSVQGALTTVEMSPGRSYRFDINRTSHLQDNAYADYVACFAEGTRLDTATGRRAVETLRPGDLVATRDGGLQPILWVGARQVLGQGPCAPVEFARGVLGNDRPLRVSAQHRILRRGGSLPILFHTDAAFVAAKHLINGETVRWQPCGPLRYWHVLLQDHHILRANGAEVDSMLPGPVAAKGFGPVAEADLAHRFPDLFGPKAKPVPLARPCLTAAEARLLPPLQRVRRARMQAWHAAA